MNRKTHSNITHRTVLTGTIVLLSLAIAAQAEYRVLHNFAGGTNDGSWPLGGLIQSGSTLYGMTGHGGSNNIGTIFKINADGNGFQLMYNFVSGGSDGSTPYGSLLLSGSTLYGMAGSENDVPYKGTLFRIGLDGTGFQVMHGFSGPTSDGRWPYDSLIQSGSTLYGMTVSGGSGNVGSCWGGTVFKINTNGTGYQIMHNFTGGSNDGTWSPGNLTQSGSTLYGMTYGGGRSNKGTVFKINTDSTGFQLLHSFTGDSNDGSKAHSSLILSDTTLYGMTCYGGTSNKGTIFKMDTDGNNFQLIHSFAGDNNDGAVPYLSSLIKSGSILYGMTPAGGNSNLGTVFQINTDSTNFQLLHSFTGTDGATPYGSLFMSGLTLYGITSAGGSSNQGVIFALDVPVTCVNPPNHDLNGDCKVDFEDFAILASGWLDCGLEPPAACNQ